MAEFEIINDEINILYNIKKEDIIKRKIRILGQNFVKNNKNKCKMIINKKESELMEEFNINNEKIIEIKLIKIAIITDMSYMFYGCSSLSSLSDISKWNTNNVTNMNSMFHGCSSLSYLPDIRYYIIKSGEVYKKNRIFYECFSLINLRDIL